MNAGAGNLASSVRADGGISFIASRRFAYVLIILTALATRAVTFGNPLVDMDDQFYWLVGRSWWNGNWPIVDIWDRKPVGLFVIYAAIAGIDRSILAVQLAATLFAAGTAVLVRAAALQIASQRAALLAAVTYILCLPLFGGQSGQSPVFYNLFMAGAGCLLLSAAAINDAPRIRRIALLAMLLAGLALVTKQVSVAEGCYFGLAFLFLLHRSGTSPQDLLVTALQMVLVALLPTLLGISLFSLADDGAIGAYIQASYFSIFTKPPGHSIAGLSGLALLLIFGAPLLLGAGIGALTSSKSPQTALAHRLASWWIAAAFAGYLLVPNFFPHYALPMLVPLSVVAARAYDQRIGSALFIALAASCLVGGLLTDLSGNRRARSEFERTAATIDAARRGGCIYVANGPVGIYAAVPACRVTKYLFPYHLTLASEANSIGGHQRDEIERIFDARPAVVVTQDNERHRQSANVRATLDRRLNADYRLIYHNSSRTPLETLRIWQRKDLAAPKG